MRFFEPRSSPPPHCGGLQLALRSFASSAVGEQPPSEAYNPQRNTNNNKKKHAFCCSFRLFVLLLEQAIRRKDVNRVAATVNVEIYRKTATRECPVGSLPR